MTRARPPATWELNPHIVLLSSDPGGVWELSVTGAGELAEGAKLFSQGPLNEVKVARMMEGRDGGGRRRGRVTVCVCRGGRVGEEEEEGEGGFARALVRQNWALSPSTAKQS